jgi:hypothetical protein
MLVILVRLGGTGRTCLYRVFGNIFTDDSWLDFRESIGYGRVVRAAPVPVVATNPRYSFLSLTLPYLLGFLFMCDYNFDPTRLPFT